jgi:polar amino acid transport system substrate-binding protein
MIKSEKIITVFIHICLVALFSTIIVYPDPGFSAEKSKKILVVSYDNWPPFTDETDPNLGICFAIVNATFKTSNYSVQPKNVPFKRADLYLRNGIEVDASPYYWYNEDRADFLYFSEPLLYNNVHIFVRSDSQITFNRIKDLKGYNIGIIRGYHNGEAFDNAKFLTKHVCNDSKQAIQMLEIGHLDIAVIDKVVAQTLIRQLNIEDRLKALPKPLFTAGLHFVVSKKNPDAQNIINALNAGLKRIQENGEYKKIMNAYGISNDMKGTDSMNN